MYRAILFDLDDTLFSLRGCTRQALEQVVLDAGLSPALPADCAATYATISSGYWAARGGEAAPQYSREDVLRLSWRDFLREHELDASDAAKLAARFWREFCRATALNPGAEAVLQRLALDYRLGMISNGYSDSQRGRLRAAGLIEVFDPLLISEEVGVAKPDARIFELALTRLGMPPAAVLYVGDSISHDREGCLRAGIDFCHYCPQPKVSDELPETQYRIARLTELIPLLLPDLTP